MEAVHKEFNLQSQLDESENEVSSAETHVSLDEAEPGHQGAQTPSEHGQSEDSDASESAPAFSSGNPYALIESEVDLTFDTRSLPEVTSASNYIICDEF